MKKILSIAAIIAGTLILLGGIAPMIIGAVLSMQIPSSSSVGIIGGADGPTAVMVVGVLGTGQVIAEIAVGICLIIAGIWGCRKSRL